MCNIFIIPDKNQVLLDEHSMPMQAKFLVLLFDYKFMLHKFNKENQKCNIGFLL
jgi:hypothetical protein